ncbi:MAG TPA: CPXCG motif-containing cysteine-rich protein [Aridibacter sp.]|nr:CPXCG motif-containing cysteine-rich protein [Aridibacter sp.]
METEHFFICPYCWQEISMLLDLSAGPQDYIEDCEVCCRPIRISFEGGTQEPEGFDAASIEQ